MQDWLLLGLAAAFMYAASGLASKIAVNREYLGVEPAVAGVYVALGVVIVFAVYFLSSRQNGLTDISPKAMLASTAVGFLWALGSLFVYIALKRSADISRISPRSSEHFPRTA